MCLPFKKKFLIEMGRKRIIQRVQAEEKEEEGRNRRKRRKLLPAITEEEISESQATGHTHHVYLVTRHDLKLPYIGYTNNLNKRRKQHAQELTGGAKKTKKMQGDVEFFITVAPFLTMRDALQFEWAWNQSLRRLSKRKLPKLYKADSSQLPVVVVIGETESKQSRATVHPLSAPLKKAILRLLDLLSCTQWTKQAIPTAHPCRQSNWTVANPLIVTWHVDPRQFRDSGIDLASSQVSFPVRHCICR